MSTKKYFRANVFETSNGNDAYIVDGATVPTVTRVTATVLDDTDFLKLVLDDVPLSAAQVNESFLANAAKIARKFGASLSNDAIIDAVENMPIKQLFTTRVGGKDITMKIVDEQRFGYHIIGRFERKTQGKRGTRITLCGYRIANKKDEYIDVPTNAQGQIRPHKTFGTEETFRFLKPLLERELSDYDKHITVELVKTGSFTHKVTDTGK